MRFLGAKCAKNAWTPMGELTALAPPDHLAGFKGAYTSRGRGGQEREGKGGKRRGGRGKGWKGKGKERVNGSFSPLRAATLQPTATATKYHQHIELYRHIATVSMQMYSFYYIVNIYSE